MVSLHYIYLQMVSKNVDLNYISVGKEEVTKGGKSIMIALMKFLLKSLSEYRFLCIGWSYELFSAMRALKKSKALVLRSLCLCCCYTFRSISLQHLEFSCSPWWGQSLGLISYLFSNDALEKQVLFYICCHKQWFSRMATITCLQT